MVSLIERNTTAVNLVERALRLIAVVKRNRTEDCGGWYNIICYLFSNGFL